MSATETSAARDDGGPGTGRRRARVLFVAEAVTLAHVARVHALAQRLDPAAYDVCIAADPRYDRLVGPHPFATLPIRSIASDTFAAALRSGRRIYDESTLERYVAADRDAIEAFDADVVVGDFRLSLPVAAAATGRRCVAIANAGWSPFADAGFPVPDLPMVRWLGVPIAQRLFDLGRPAAFRRHAAPLNAVRRRHGLAALPADLRATYTDGDDVVYADVPELFPMRDLPPTHRFVGAVLWDPRVALPDWWDALPVDRPLVYVTLGSSGDATALRAIVDGVATLPVTVVAATAGRVAGFAVPDRVFVADFLPGSALCRRAAVVVCNGGSPTCYQAFAEGVPVLGIPSNLDQFLNMAAVERFGAGRLLRTGRASRDAVASIVRELIERPAARDAAAVLRRAIERHRVEDAFSSTIDAAVVAGGRAPDDEQSR